MPSTPYTVERTDDPEWWRVTIDVDAHFVVLEWRDPEIGPYGHRHSSVLAGETFFVNAVDAPTVEVVERRAS